MVIHATGVNYSVLSEHLSLFNEAFSVSAISGAWTLETTTGLARLSDEVERQASMIGYINAFYLFSAFAASVIPFIPFLKKPPTRSPPLRSFSFPFRASGFIRINEASRLSGHWHEIRYLWRRTAEMRFGGHR